MISAKDRVPLYPGRTKMTPVSGQPNVYDMMRADQPQQEGTPLNRRTMQLLQADIRSYPVKAGESVVAGDVVDVVGGVVTAGRKPVGSLAVGSVVRLNVGGVSTEFIVAHHGKPSSIYSNTFTGNTILLMKDCYESRQWNTSRINDYANSTIHAYLNGAFLDLLDADVKSKIVQVKIPYRPGSGTSKTVNSGESGLSAKVWLPSAYEVGSTQADNSDIPIDGGKFDFFDSGVSSAANTKRVALLGAAQSKWGIRTPSCIPGEGDARVCDVEASGLMSVYNYADFTAGVRPTLVLPDNFYAIQGTIPSQAIALRSGTAGQSIDVIFDGTAELPGITAGTSITSPGVQGYSPQDGWVWVKPEWAKTLPPTIIGTYSGDNSVGRKIVLGFRPSAVFISTSYVKYTTTILALSGFNIYDNSGSARATLLAEGAGLTDDGFTLSRYETNVSGQIYSYVALR